MAGFPAAPGFPTRDYRDSPQPVCLVDAYRKYKTTMQAEPVARHWADDGRSNADWPLLRLRRRMVSCLLSCLTVGITVLVKICNSFVVR